MAKLTEDVTRIFETQTDSNAVSVAAGEKIFKGAVVGCAATGYGRSFQVGDTLMGIALDSADNTNGADGDIKVDVKGAGKIVLEFESVTQEKIGSSVYVTDDNTFSLEESGGTYFGAIIRLEDDKNAVVSFDFLNVAKVTTIPEVPEETTGEDVQP